MNDNWQSEIPTFIFFGPVFYFFNQKICIGNIIQPTTTAWDKHFSHYHRKFMTFGPSILNAFPYVIRPWHLTFQVVVAPRCCEFATSTPSRSGWTHSQNRICNCLGFSFPTYRMTLCLLEKLKKIWRFWNRKTPPTPKKYTFAVSTQAQSARVTTNFVETDVTPISSSLAAAKWRQNHSRDTTWTLSIKRRAENRSHLSMMPFWWNMINGP